MKSQLLLFATAVFSFTAIRAQTTSKFTFAGGVRLGLPVGTFNFSHSFGIGGELQGEVKIADNVSIPFSAGYTHFFGKTISSGVKLDGVGLIPILAGVRFYPSSEFFLGGKIGYGILTGSRDSEGALDYEPHIGYNGSKIQVALGYNGFTKNSETLGHIALVTVVKLN